MEPARKSSRRARTDARGKGSTNSHTHKGGRGAPGAGPSNQESSPARETGAASGADTDWRSEGTGHRTGPGWPTCHMGNPTR